MKDLFTKGLRFKNSTYEFILNFLFLYIASFFKSPITSYGYCLQSNVFFFTTKKGFFNFGLLLIFIIAYNFTFGETIYAMESDLKDSVEYWQDQIYSIDSDIQEANLNRPDSELTPKELAIKQEALEGKKEAIENRRHYMQEYSKAKKESGSTNLSTAGQKRLNEDNTFEGPSKK